MNTHPHANNWHREFGWDIATAMAFAGSTLARPTQQQLAVVSLLVAAAALRFFHLGHESLWFDEAISFRRSGYPFGELVAESIRAYHNPTYFMLLRVFRCIGDSEFALRLPSALFGVAKVLLVYYLGKIAVGHREGCFAALYILLSRYQIHYDQEARMYAPLLFAIAAALSGIFWLLSNLELVTVINPLDVLRRRVIPGVDSKRVAAFSRAWLAFVAGSLFALYLHNTAVLFVVSCWLVAALVVLFTRAKTRRHFVHGWLIANTCIVIGFLPWLRTLFGQAEAMNEHGYGRPLPRFDQALKVLRDVYLMGQSSPTLTVFVLALAAFGLWSLRRNRLLLSALVVLSVSAPILFGLVSLKEPMFLPRLMLWAALPFSVLVGAGIAQVPLRYASFGVATVLVALNLWHLKRDYYGKRQKPDWHGAITMLAGIADEHTRVLAVGDREWRLFSYYFERKDEPIPRFAVEFSVAKMQEDLRAVVGGAATAWTIRVRDYPEGTSVRAALATLGTKVTTKNYGPRLVLERYDLRTLQ